MNDYFEKVFVLEDHSKVENFKYRNINLLKEEIYKILELIKFPKTLELFSFLNRYLTRELKIILKGSSKYPIFGVIKSFWEKLVKNRLIAIKSTFEQCYLYSYHQLYQIRCSEFSNDKVFNQWNLGTIIKNLKKKRPFGSADGKSWTDYFPLAFINGIIQSDLSYLSTLNEEFSVLSKFYHLSETIFKGTFFFPKKEGGSYLNYNKGTPMGLYGSFALTNFCHHIFLRFSIMVFIRLAEKNTQKYVSRIISAILGDDIIKTVDKEKNKNKNLFFPNDKINLYEVYEFIFIEILGMEINKKKSFLPNEESGILILEFAKRFLLSYNGEVLDLSRVPTSILLLDQGYDRLRFLTEVWVYYFNFNKKFDTIGCSIITECFGDLRGMLDKYELTCFFCRLLYRCEFSDYLLNSLEFSFLVKRNLNVSEIELINNSKEIFKRYRDNILITSIDKIKDIGDLDPNTLKSLSMINSELLESKVILSLDTIFCAILSLELNNKVRIYLREDTSKEDLLKNLSNLIESIFQFFDYRYEILEGETIISKDMVLEYLENELKTEANDLNISPRFSDNLKIRINDQYTIDLRKLSLSVDFHRSVSRIDKDFRTTDSFMKFLKS
jgi:hypothetical protein